MIYEYNGSNLADGLYYFYASWNSRCNVLAERITRLNLEFSNLTIYKVNTTKYANMKKEYKMTTVEELLPYSFEEIENAN